MKEPKPRPGCYVVKVGPYWHEVDPSGRHQVVAKDDKEDLYYQLDLDGCWHAVNVTNVTPKE